MAFANSCQRHPAEGVLQATHLFDPPCPSSLCPANDNLQASGTPSKWWKAVAMSNSTPKPASNDGALFCCVDSMVEDVRSGKKAAMFKTKSKCGTRHECNASWNVFTMSRKGSPRNWNGPSTKRFFVDHFHTTFLKHHNGAICNILCGIMLLQRSAGLSPPTG
jgi:hypothetical protein